MAFRLTTGAAKGSSWIDNEKVLTDQKGGIEQGMRHSEKDAWGREQGGDREIWDGGWGKTRDAIETIEQNTRPSRGWSIGSKQGQS